jgi:hypothetical protein
MKNPFKLETYGLYKRTNYKTNRNDKYVGYEGSVLRDKLLKSNITLDEVVKLKELYKTVCAENREKGTIEYIAGYDDLLDSIRKLPKDLLMYHIGTLHGMIAGYRKYNLV